MAHIESRTRSIEQLIADVRSGRLRVPRFQRLFVWRADQVLALLESVRLRYPIGTLFIWRTPERHSSFDYIGTIPLPQDSPPEGAEVGYVLDGHQRVSALVGALGLSDQEAEALKGADRVFLVYYDLKERKFVHAQRPDRQQLPVRYLLPVAIGAAEDPLVEWLDERKDAYQRGTAERQTWDQYARDANALRTTFAQYNVRYDDVTGADLVDALDIFVRVNRQGTPAKQEEVFAALSYKPGGFDFAQRAEEIISARNGFESLSTSVVLRALMRSLGESAYERGWTAILKKHAKSVADHMDRVGEALQRALDFLGTPEIGARHARVVPYAVQVVLLTRFFELLKEPDPSQKERLHRWFWASSYGAVYGGAGALSLDEHIERAERLTTANDLEILPQRPVLQPLPRRFHPRAARVRAWHLFLASLTPLDPDSGSPVREPLQNGILDVRPLFSGELAMQLGARLLVGRLGGDPWRRLKRAESKSYFNQLLDSHAIPLEAYEAARAGDSERFVDLRYQRVAELERERALRFTSASPEEDVYDEPVIDIEEDDGDQI